MRILVIDDAADIRLFVSAVLEGAGHQVLTAEDSMKAISLLSVADVDALILDVLMPRFTGFELLEILRRDPRARLLPVLLMSSLTDAEERDRGLRLGAVDFLSKPVDPEDLVVRVERLVSQHAVSPGGAAGDLGRTDLVGVVQGLQQQARTGVLALAGAARRGEIELREGAVVGARHGLREGAEAIFSMLALRGVRFRFEPIAEAELQAAPGEVLPFSQLAIRASRLEEELNGCRDHLPADDACLYIAGPLSAGTPPAVDLPYAEVYERIDALPGVTLAELDGHELTSSIKVRLTVAVLARAGAIEAAM